MKSDALKLIVVIVLVVALFPILVTLLPLFEEADR